MGAVRANRWEDVRGRPRRALALAWFWTRYVAQRQGPLGDAWDWAATTLFRRPLLEHATPWITFGAARWLRTEIRPGSRVFEWGCGASTFFFAGLGADVVSVESDPTWHARVSALVLRRGLRGVALHLRPPQPASEVDPASSAEVPGGYATSDAAHRGMLFQRYAQAILDHPAGHFDAILVDGRARVSCAALAAERVRPGGLLLLDNAERANYLPALARLRDLGWEERSFEGPVPAVVWPPTSCTNAFRRPAK